MNRFGNYEILYSLKEGGMGAVLLARRKGPGAVEQLGAIKTIPPEYATAANVRAMFLDEAAILARLNHPAIAHVHDFGEEGGALYMVMEYVAGIPFRDLGDTHMPPVVAARAIAEAARGLHAAHEVHDLAGHAMGLVHRDISPDNLMLGYDGHVKVIDFGIALVKNRQAPVTEFGTVKGKPPYMSPEQVKNEAMDRRSDVFSLGIVLWEMLTGTQLFVGDSIFAIAYAVDNQPIAPPSQALGAPLPLGLDAVVMNALDRDPARRTPTAAALAEQLDDVVQAAGGESLEAWASRELAGSAAQHRKWLAGVVAGEAQLPKLKGRPSAQVTELAAGAAPVEAVAPIVTRTPEPPAETSIGGSASALDLAPRRKLAPLALVLVLVLLAGGTAVYFATRTHEAAPAVVKDAAVAVVVADAAIAPVPVAVDAAVPEPVAVDAAVPVAVDAGRRAVVRDAGHAMRADAAPVIDAAPPLQGTGYLVAKHTKGRYLNVIVDGQQVGVTPMLGRSRKLPAGPHTIELVDPKDGTVIVQKRVTVQPGEPVEVDEP
ncbi:MAG: serine/threonine protein kinase [Acidobacteriota bacterium]